MAGCYSSSASAPLHALANQFLGESTFSAKSSLFRPTSHSSSPSSARYHNPRPGQGQGFNQGGLFPRHHHHQQQQHYSKYQPGKQQTVNDTNTFERAWSTSSSALQHQQDQPRNHYQSDPWATQFNSTHQRPTPNQRYLHDLDLVSSWDHAATATVQPVSGASLIPSQELAPEALDAFYYQPSETPTTDSLWAQELVQAEPVSPPTTSTTLLQGANNQADDDDDDEEDEFREEWNNDHFTQAYINTHQSQFQQIEEQDRIKEARLAEERERQRASSGGPPRSSYSWMMTGVPSPSTAMDAAIAGVTSNTPGQRRLQVPGLDPEKSHHQGVSARFSISEFEAFNYNSHSAGTFDSTPTMVARPIRAEDRFPSLVNDLHLAEQTYYPPASSATLPADNDMGLESLVCQPVPTITNNSAWAQEFSTTGSSAQQQQASKKFLGAEWNWEKLFGKDPRKSVASSSSIIAAAGTGSGAAAIDESERLRAVALARLQAVFKHLSLASSSAASPS
ncbi:hypothetical protein EC991_008346 [Linnemannia zychae]|nr:hypothetical protein EC991_008346 [Linnemannia zychae]